MELEDLLISGAAMDIPKIEMDEGKFRWGMNEDAMATEKLAEGIRKFAADARKLEIMMREKIEKGEASNGAA